MLEASLDRRQPQRLIKRAGQCVRIHRARIDSATELQLSELPGIEAQAAVKDLGEPVAERLLAADDSLELELGFFWPLRFLPDAGVVETRPEKGTYFRQRTGSFFRSSPGFSANREIFDLTARCRTGAPSRHAGSTVAVGAETSGVDGLGQVRRRTQDVASGGCRRLGLIWTLFPGVDFMLHLGHGSDGLRRLRR